MLTLLTVVCLSALCWGDKYDSPNSDTEHYWKEYFNGKVPADAIPGGHDKDGNITYVGMVVQPDGKGLLIATIYPEQYAISQASYGGGTNTTFIHKRNIQILCSRHHQCYNWVPITVNDFYNVKGQIVRGFAEWGVDVYIGRGHYNGEVSIGRVYRPENEHQGLWLTDRYNGKYYYLKDFEVLVYSDVCSMCTLDIEAIGNSIDVRPA